jgi:hypothetical protein
VSDNVKRSVKLNVDPAELAELNGVMFRPTPAQKEAKSRFWAIMNEGLQMKDPMTYSSTDVADLLRTPLVVRWFSEKGFKDFFFNKFEGEQKLEVLWDKALDAMAEILDTSDPKAQSARVSVIRLLAEMRQAKRQPKMLDRAIQEMDLDQLNAFIEKQTLKVLPQAPSEEEKDGN